MSGIVKTGPWAEVRKALKSGGGELKEALRKSVLQEAHYLRAKVVEGIKEQAPGGEKFVPLAPTTLATRKSDGFGGAKALIVHTPGLHDSITVSEHGESVFVGVLRSARGADGAELANVASIHEYGAGPFVIRVTEAMRRYLMGMLREQGLLDGSGSGTMASGFLVIRIPPRPFLGPVWRQEAQPASKLEDRLVARLKQNLGEIGIAIQWGHGSGKVTIGNSSW